MLLTDDCIGDGVASKAAMLQDSQVQNLSTGHSLSMQFWEGRTTHVCMLQVLLLENTRFHAGECQNDPHFSQQVRACRQLLSMSLPQLMPSNASSFRGTPPCCSRLSVV